VLCEKLKITAIDEKTVKKAAAEKAIEDFEDALQYYSALNAKCKCIITEDKNHFYFSAIEVLSAEEFLLKHVVKK
jgi:predicted nucleic acid-binding protein